MRRFATFTLAVTWAALLPLAQPIAAQVMDFSGVPSALTVADTERLFGARAGVVNFYNACRGKVLGQLFKDELDFTTVAIAKLEYGGRCPNEQQDNIPEVQQALMNVQVRDDWHLGTDFQPLRNGELDVATRGLITILYRYREKIGPQVYNHILNDFLARVVSGPPPVSLWYDFDLGGVSIPETENHILNAQTSRYLTNQLLGINNEQNGFNRWMLLRLRQLLQNDFSEYNARPYQHYHMMALQNLYDFAWDLRVKVAAQMVLDYVSAKFAVSGNGLRRAVPFRRLRDHIDNPMFNGDGDHQTFRFLMLAGITRPQALPAGNRSTSGAYIGTDGRDDMQLAAVTSYRVPDLVADVIVSPWRNNYFQRIRGTESTTDQPRAAGVELYSRSAPFLISAGGIWQVSPHSDRFGDELNCYADAGWPLATMLVPNADGTQYSDFIRLEGDTTEDTVRSDVASVAGGAALGGLVGGPLGAVLGGILGSKLECKVPYRHRQNTCVAPGFACGLQPVIPASYQNCRVDETGANGGHWTFIDASENSSCGRNPGFCVEVYSGNWRLGLVTMSAFGFFDAAPSRQGSCAWFHDAVKQNFSRTFQPTTVNEYVTAMGHRIQFVPATGNQYAWGIVSVDGRTYDTNIGDWPLAEGDIINSCEHNPCQPGDGHNGYITIDNPVWGKRLILDMRDPMNPQRTEIDLKSQNSSGTVARTPNHLDVFWVANNGAIASTWWDDNFNNGRWNPTFAVSPPNAARVIAPNATPVASVARLPGHLDVFWVGSDGSVGSNWWDATVNNGAWNQPFVIAPPNSARWNSPVVAVARTPNHLDVFWIAPDGSISSAWWDGNFNNARWNPPFSVAPRNSAGPEAGITAVARTPSHLDVYWVGADGSVVTNWWDANVNGGRWNNPFSIAPPNAARINSPVAAVARTPNHLDVFWIDNASGISTNWWDANFNNGAWNSPFLVAPVNSASAASGLTALARFRDHIDVFWVGWDGSVGSTWWDAGFNSGRWNPPFSLAPPGSAAVTSPVSAVARTPDHIDVFWLGRDGSVASDWWDVFANNARWNNPFGVANAGAAQLARLESSNDYAAARTPDHLDVFWTVSDGEVFSKWWDVRANSARWNGVFSLFTLPPGPPAPPKLNSAQNEGDPASLGGPPPGGVKGGSLASLKRGAPGGPVGPPAKGEGNGQAGQNQAGQNTQEELNWLARPNSPVAAVARTPDHLDVFWINKAGQIWSDSGDSATNHFWNTKFVAVTPAGVAGPDSGLTALARRSDLLDVFWIGNDGAVWSNWYNGRWNSPFSISPGTQVGIQKASPPAGNAAQTPPPLDHTARPNSPLAAVARTPDHLDVFWISKEGQIWSNWWDGQVNHGAWNVPFNINVAPPPPPSSGKFGLAQNAHGTTITITSAAVAHGALQLSPALDRTAGPSAGIAAVSRTPDHLDVFWVGNDGWIWTNWWNQWASNARWNSPFNISQGPVVPPAPSPTAAGNLKEPQPIQNVHGTQGVRSNTQGIEPLQGPDRTARPNSPVVAVARTPEHLDVFWIGNDGAIWTTWWDARINAGAWNTPFQISGRNAAAPNSVLSVLARMPQHLDVFWTAPDGSVISNWWDAWVNRGTWNAPFRVWPP